MENRRSFLKKAALLAGSTAAVHMLPLSIQRALAIDAAEGSTFLDAEHIVFLMQENRSFDHCYGTLKGVRGFSDPRAVKQPNGLPVWMQQDLASYVSLPFRLDIENSKTSWMGSLPHSWKDMVHARNDGKMDMWLEAKRAGNAAFQQLPLTMGYHTRQDIPFYYALADAFTVCDQHFCSSLTGTSANRSYFWSGTIREEAHNPESTAHVDNGQINYKNVGWKTFPERLEEAGVSWKVYQNELSVPVGFVGEEEDWLANFTDNNLEFHQQYHVRFHPAHRQYMATKLQQIEQQLAELSENDDTEKKRLSTEADRLRLDLANFSEESFNRLDNFSRAIHQRAFTTNIGDPDYHRLETITYEDQRGKKEVEVPKGDLFYQFRQDAKNGALPTVSWLVAPCRFSDHPGSPWYGAWYVSEAMDILTADPELWKKTIFILTYDENDGYFDHVPPFVPPHSERPESGALANGLHTAEEYVTLEQERKRSGNNASELESPIGLGFRVPLVIASPWTKGGRVNSEVFDLTSSLQFLEYFIAQKYNKHIVEDNLSAWRRLVCGNLTSVFAPADKVSPPALTPVDRDAYVARIYTAKDQDLPTGFVRVAAPDAAIAQQMEQNWQSPQEPGTKEACAIPYDMEVNATVDLAENTLTVTFYVGGALPKTKKIGVPFFARAGVSYAADSSPGKIWNFAVREGEPVTYSWSLDRFNGDLYHIEVYGPNGFYRSFKGSKAYKGSKLVVRQLETSTNLSIVTKDNHSAIKLRDLSYNPGERVFRAHSFHYTMDTAPSFGWYDVCLTDQADPHFNYQYAGHLETGRKSVTDPLMGQQVSQSAIRT